MKKLLFIVSVIFFLSIFTGTLLIVLEVPSILGEILILVPVMTILAAMLIVMTWMLYEELIED